MESLFFILTGSLLFTKTITHVNASNLAWWFLFFWCLFVNISAISLYIFFQDLTLLYGSPSDFYLNVSDDSWKKAFILFGIINSIYFFQNTKKNFKLRDSYIISKLDVKLGFTFVLIGFVFITINSLLLLPKITSEHYAIIYSGSISQALPLMWLWNLIYNFGLFLVLSNWHPKFTKYIFLIIIAVGVIGSLTGARSFIVSSSLFVIWFYSITTKSSVNLKLFFTFFIAFILSFILSTYRSRDSFNFQNILSSFNYFSTSVKHVVYFLELDTSFNDKFPYLLSNLVFIFQFFQHGKIIMGQTEFTAENRFDLNHILSSSVNMDSYLNGSGMGTFFISESMQYGMFFTILIAFFTPKIILWVQANIVQNKNFRGFSYLFFTWAILIPRSSLLPDVWYISKVLILLFMYRITLKFVNILKI